MCLSVWAIWIVRFVWALVCLMHVRLHLNTICSLQYYFLKPRKATELFLFRYFPQTRYIYLANLIALCVVRVVDLLYHIILFSVSLFGEGGNASLGAYCYYYHRLALPPFSISPQAPLVTSTPRPQRCTTWVSVYIESQQGDIHIITRVWVCVMLWYRKSKPQQRSSPASQTVMSSSPSSKLLLLI